MMDVETTVCRLKATLVSSEGENLSVKARGDGTLSVTELDTNNAFTTTRTLVGVIVYAAGRSVIHRASALDTLRGLRGDKAVKLVDDGEGALIGWECSGCPHGEHWHDVSVVPADITTE